MDALHNGFLIQNPVLSELYDALGSQGVFFRAHPVWKLITGGAAATADQIVFRLASTIGDKDLCRFYGGYASDKHFRAELNAWSKYYSTSRRSMDIRNARIVERAAAIIGPQPEADTSVPVHASHDAAHQDTGSRAIQAYRDTSDHLYIACDLLPDNKGIAIASAVSEAVRTTLSDDVIAGLVANQKLIGLAKGKQHLVILWYFVRYNILVSCRNVSKRGPASVF